MGKKLTYESIKNYIDDEITGNGCKLSTTEEEFNQEKIKQNKNNSHVSLNLKCKCGNDFTKSYDAFKYSKKQCNKCSGLERPTIEYIKYFIEIESKSNCKLISTEYIDAHKLLELECNCGNPFKKNWNKFYSANQRTCNDCSNKLSGEKSKTPYEEIKNYIEIESKSGCELITSKDKYIDTNTDINIKCKCGNYFQTTFHQFKSEQSKKRQCDECGNKARGIKLSKPYEEVKITIENTGCELLTKICDYKNADSFLKIKCNCGNPFTTSYSLFNRHTNPQNKCEECRSAIFRRLVKVPYDEVIGIFKDENCKLLVSEEEYYAVREDDKLEYKCSCGNTSRISLAKFKYGGRCNNCSEKHRYTYEEVKSIVEAVEGYKLLSTEYIGCKEYLDIQCDKGHPFPMTFTSFNSGGHRCPICNIGGNYKYDLEIAKEIFKAENCELLAKEYINTDIPMPYICSCGKLSTIALKEFMHGQRCKECGYKKTGDKLRTPYIEVINLFKDNDCELLTPENEIQNGKTKVKYICSCGNPDEVTIEKFKAGERCNKCKQQRVEEIFLEKYGYKSVLSNPEIREKIRQTLYKNGTAPCSKQQIYINQLIGGELNYPLRNLSLDIAFPEEMIYLEYDGGGHENNIIFGTMSKDDFIKKERNRTYGLLRSGWKEIRIISRNDNIPSDQIILEILSYARTYLNQNHHYIKFDIDNNKIINSQGEFDFDYGELRKIKLTDLKEAI